MIPSSSSDDECPGCLLRLGLMASGWKHSVAGRTAAPEPKAIEALLEDIEVLQLIGAGGMGAVYLARQPKLDRLVAIKLLMSDRAADPVFQERFLREARTLARLKHPQIVSLYDVGRAGASWYILMEYVDGANLRSLIEDGQLSPNEAMRLVPQLCDAIQYAHDQGVVHRDIKPENILVDQNGQIKIADFGLAKLMGSRQNDCVTLTDIGLRMGTAAYMAPEQSKPTDEVDHRADIYALGIIFYEMLTGKRPALDYTKPSRLTDVDARIDRIVSRCLRESPDERFQHASELKSEIDWLSAQKPTSFSKPAILSGIALLVALVCIMVLPWLLSANSDAFSTMLPSAPTPKPLILVAPFSDQQAVEQQRAWAEALELPSQIVDNHGVRFQIIPPGDFELAIGHTARITKPFYISDTEITVGLFREFVTETGYRTEAEKSGFGGWVHPIANSQQIESRQEFIWSHPFFASSDELPVTLVAMKDIEAFLHWISKRDGRTYRLPTNAEWTWASNAGNPQRLLFGNGDQASDFGWHGGNSGNRAHPVRSKKSNPWGLFDAFGNACEYTRDGYLSQLPVGSFDDPCQPVVNNRFAGQGSSFADPFEILLHDLNGEMPFYSVGFRIVFEIEKPNKAIE